MQLTTNPRLNKIHDRQAVRLAARMVAVHRRRHDCWRQGDARRYAGDWRGAQAYDDKAAATLDEETAILQRLSALDATTSIGMAARAAAILACALPGHPHDPDEEALYALAEDLLRWLRATRGPATKRIGIARSTDTEALARHARAAINRMTVACMTQRAVEYTQGPSRDPLARVGAAPKYRSF